MSANYEKARGHKMVERTLGEYFLSHYTSSMSCCKEISFEQLGKGLSCRRAPHKKECLVAKKTKQKSKKKTVARRLYTKEDLKLLKAHSKSRTPVERIAKLMKRSGATLRQKARAIGLPLGHRR